MKKQIDTIVASTTPQGRGGVAIIRVSGSLVSSIAKEILKKIPKARYATFSSFFDSSDHAIDQGIALYFPAPNSFTGEDILELQGHGGPVVVDDLIDVSSAQAAKNALRSLQGEFSKKIHALVEALTQVRMYVEVAIDFVEEEIDFLKDQQVITSLTSIVKELEAVQTSAAQGSLLRDGITAVIAGQPNVGKSSLLNQLSGKESAIVTDIPGTTRDVLREHILIDSLPIHIVDTAGLSEIKDNRQQKGIR